MADENYWSQQLPDAKESNDIKVHSLESSGKVGKRELWIPLRSPRP